MLKSICSVPVIGTYSSLFCCLSVRGLIIVLDQKAHLAEANARSASIVLDS